MYKFNALKADTKINNTELCELFGCSPQGGMRRAHKTNTLVIVSNHIKFIYDDRCQFDAACTEFSCQGLELSLALFNWGQDMVFRNGKLVVEDRRQYKHYTEGSYRVLLSR
ncbi:DNA/RNA helicase domain-containing protein, partial [Vibrio anguillarum]